MSFHRSVAAKRQLLFPICCARNTVMIWFALRVAEHKKCLRRPKCIQNSSSARTAADLRSPIDRRTSVGVLSGDWRWAPPPPPSAGRAATPRQTRVGRGGPGAEGSHPRPPGRGRGRGRGLGKGRAGPRGGCEGGCRPLRLAMEPGSRAALAGGLGPEAG